MNTKTLDLTIGSGVASLPLWVTSLTEWAHVLALVLGLLLVATRLVLAIRECCTKRWWRCRGKQENDHAKSYCKKPVVIQAAQWFQHGDHPAVISLPVNHPIGAHAIAPAAYGWVPTLEGGHVVTPGDWIITGVPGGSTTLASPTSSMRPMSLSRAMELRHERHRSLRPRPRPRALDHLVLAVTSLGLNLSPDVQEAITSLATAIAGLALALLPTGGGKE